MFLKMGADNMEKIFMKEKSMKKIIIALTLIASLLPAQVVGMNKFQLKKVNRTSCAQSPIIGNSNPFLPEITTKKSFCDKYYCFCGFSWRG